MSFPRISIEPVAGSPSLMVDGLAAFPLVMMTTPKALAGWNAHRKFDVPFVTFTAPFGWTAIDTWDFTELDRMLEAFAAEAPDALLLPRIHLDPPAAWMDANPGELVGYAEPRGYEDDKFWGGARKASFASERWLTEASDALRKHVRHVASSPMAKRMLGWHIGAGIYGEWHYPNAVYFPDTSEVFAQAYQRWTVAQGRDAAAARVPSADDRKRGGIGMFREPKADGWQVDYARFLHHTGAAALQRFAKVVKEETDGRSLVLAFNGYLPDLGVTHEIDHRAFHDVLDMPEVDAFSSPHTYQRRKPGEDGMLRGFLGSVAARGKLWIDEADERTHRAAASVWTHVTEEAAAVELVWRSFAQSLTHSVGLWFMDQGAMWYPDADGAWYRDAAIIDAISAMRDIGEASMTWPRERVSEVAVVLDLEAEFYTASPDVDAGEAAAMDQVSPKLTNAMFGELNRCGAPFDLFDLRTLAGGVDREYKAYVFLNVWTLSATDRAWIEALRDTGRSLLFCYAAGVLDGAAGGAGVNVAQMSELLGMPVEMVDEDTAIGGGQRPGFRVVGADEDERLHRAGNVWFAPSPPVAAGDLRRFIAAAGVHEYLATDDVVMVNASSIAVHAATDGVKRLSWPYAANWRDLRRDLSLAAATDVCEVEMKRGETLLLHVQAA